MTPAQAGDHVSGCHTGDLGTSWNGLFGAFRLEFLDIKLQQKYCTYLLKIRSVRFQDKKIMRISFTYISLFIEVRASNMIKVIKEKLK